MRVAVLADTHNKLPPDLSGRLAAAEEIWHLGDVCAPETLAPLERLGKPLRVVRGNCDDEDGEWPLTVERTIAGREVMLIHIPPRRAPVSVDILLHGHTHVPRREVIGGCLFLNPGCITRPNRGAPASFAWLELHADAEPLWEIVPLR